MSLIYLGELYTKALKKSLKFSEEPYKKA